MVKGSVGRVVLMSIFAHVVTIMSALIFSLSSVVKHFSGLLSS